MRFATQFQGIRRRALLALVAVALMMALLPTAAFASSGKYGNYGPQRRYPQQQNYRQQQNYQRPSQKHSYCATSYKVRKGDTLSGVARHYRVSVRQLANANGIKNPNRIYSGQTLCISR